MAAAERAGKTTAVKVLATLTRPDAGTALIDGIHVVANPKAVRRIIDRFRSLPINSSPPEFLAGEALLLFFSYAFSWVMAQRGGIRCPL